MRTSDEIASVNSRSFRLPPECPLLRRPAIPPEPPQKKEKRVELKWPSPTLPLLLEGFHAPAFSTTNVDLPALDVLAELLFSERVPLYKRLVIKEQKVETLAGSNDAHVDPYLFTVPRRRG